MIVPGVRPVPLTRPPHIKAPYKGKWQGSAVAGGCAVHAQSGPCPHVTLHAQAYPSMPPCDCPCPRVTAHAQAYPPMPPCDRPCPHVTLHVQVYPPSERMERQALYRWVTSAIPAPQVCMEVTPATFPEFAAFTGKPLRKGAEEDEEALVPPKVGDTHSTHHISYTAPTTYTTPHTTCMCHITDTIV